MFKGGSNELVMPVKVTITGENELTVDVKRWRSGGEEATPDMRWALQFISIPKLGERYTVKVNVRNDDTYKNYNGFEYDILTDDETGQKYVELLNYRGLEETVIVPDRIERLPVISTAHQLFRGNKIIKKVTMPAGMTTLGSRAFMGCTSLDTVTLPASLQRLEESTFEGCTALRYVYFGDESGESSQTTVIDANAFLNCTGIFEINLPAKLTAVMNNAFLGCTNLRVSADSNTNGVTLPRTIETISYKSFGYDKDGNKIASFYIYGYSDTAAERYAANNGFSFRKKDNAGPIDFTVDEIYSLIWRSPACRKQSETRTVTASRRRIMTMNGTIRMMLSFCICRPSTSSISRISARWCGMNPTDWFRRSYGMRTGTRLVMTLSRSSSSIRWINILTSA